MVAFGMLFLVTVVGDHYYFRTPTFDYGVYNFAFWDYAHFHLSNIPSCRVVSGGNMNFLQDNFSFTLMYFVPVYWLFNWLTETYTLLIIEVVLILWSAWALYRLIILKTGDGWLGLFAVLYYFLLQGRYSAFSTDANICTLASCFVPVSIYYFEAKRYFFAIVLLILSLFSREDMALWFIFIFLVLIIWHWKEKDIVKKCIYSLVACILYLVLLFKIFIPALDTPTHHYWLFNYPALGKGPGDALLFMFEHPFKTIKLLFVNHLPDHLYDSVKMEFYWVYFISGGFILFYNPQYLIWFIPLIAQKMFNDDPIHWSILGYFSIPVVTMLPISVFIIISKFKSDKFRYSISILICLLTLCITWYKMNPERRKMPWQTTTVKENIFDPTFFHPAFDAKSIHTDLKLIPEDAKVCASGSILSHVSARKYAYEFPDVEDADYIALFAFHDWYLSTEENYNAELYKYLFSTSWKLISNDYPFLLMQKEANQLSADSLSCNAETLSADKLHFVASNGELLDNANSMDSTKKHWGASSAHLTKENPYGFTYHGVNYKSGDFLKISVWKYPVENEDGSLVISCGKDFYISHTEGETNDSSGWTQINIYLRVPDDHSDFKIYVWNKGTKDIWFDDLKIMKLY